MPENIRKEDESFIKGESERHGPDEHEHHGHHGPHGPNEGIPPYILKEILDLKEKVGKLEGMMEILVKKL